MRGAHTRTAFRWLTSFVAFALCAELLGLAAYYVDTGALFYIHHKEYGELFSTPQDRLAVGEAVHPYFGFTHTPRTPFSVPPGLESGAPLPAARTNNFGFASPHDYPFPKTRGSQFVVGLFGGSVGVWFCQLGAPRLVEQLQRHPSLRAREIVPLCFSHEGYKQPQEALVLAYFLSIGQPFDLVINIDGFNDVALGSLNNSRGLDISMPSVQHIDPLINLVNASSLTPEKLETLAAIFRDRQRLAALLQAIRANRIAAVHFVLDWYYARVRNRYVQALGRYSNLPSNPQPNSLIQVTPAVTPRDGDALFEDIAAEWARSSLLMHHLLASRGVRYVHILQPNQYFGGRRFSPQEAATALGDASPYKASVSQGYPALSAAAQSTLRGTVHFVDATTVFDRESAPMYVDNCCHYTVAGNRVLADAIAAAIVR